MSRNNLATTYRAAGRISEAITLYEQDPGRPRTHAWDPTTPDTLQSRNNLARVYRDAGREEEARRLES